MNKTKRLLDFLFWLYFLFLLFPFFLLITFYTTDNMSILWTTLRPNRDECLFSVVHKLKWKFRFRLEVIFSAFRKYSFFMQQLGSNIFFIFLPSEKVKVRERTHSLIFWKKVNKMKLFLFCSGMQDIFCKYGLETILSLSLRTPS